VDSRYFVTFQSADGTVLSVLLDAPSPVLSGGVGGWEVVDRPKRVAITRFKGVEPLRQDIAVVFDGVKEGESQESRISTLINMAQQPGDLTAPPKIKLDGTVLRTDLDWVIEGIDWDSQNTMWDRQGGLSVRLRQHAVVHMLQFVDDDVLVTAPSPAVVNKPKSSGKPTTSHGLTLKQIAAAEYGDPDKYWLILAANPWLDPDPRKVIPEGTPVFIPSDQGSAPTTFIVP